MMRAGATFFTLISVVIFPWQITAVCALAAAFVEPLVPLAAGLLLDVFYYQSQTGLFPRYTILGAAISLVASIVHSRVRARTM